MSNVLRKIQKNADDWAVKNYYANMTPQMYQDGIQRAIKMTEDRLTKQYEAELKRMQDKYNDSIKDGTLLAMDTLAVEMVYELGKVLDCYKDEPDEYLDQKVDIVQGIYDRAMQSIQDYADKYKNSTQAHKAFEKKRKLIKKVFGIYGYGYK